MNRICLFLCFLCIPWVARGQSAYEWHYWFDSEKDHQYTGRTPSATFSIEADAAGLSTDLHVIHWQVSDDQGRLSSPQSRLFYRVADRTVSRLLYWFDNDDSNIETKPIQDGHATIDVNHLEPGIHFIYCQAIDAYGNVSDVVTNIFYRTMRDDMATWSYWFDGDEEARQTTSCPNGTVLVDVSSLPDGFHTIYSQVSEQKPSAVITRWFIKIPQTIGSEDMSCICTVDEKIVGQTRVPAKGGIISWAMDVDALPVGLHRAVFQVITASGAASTIAERFFVRAITPAEVGNMQCVYTLDNSDTQSMAGTMANGLFHFDLDVAALEDGLHRIAYMMVAEDGSTTPQQTAFFWKIPLGGNGIVQYDYWLNNEEQNMKSFHLDKRENPFRLISLLPVDAQPIRSSCFHFEVKDDQPMIYAKNDFHIRFYDTEGRCLNDSRQFADYQVKQDVEPIGELQSTQTFDKVATNDIRWYTMQAAPGDTAAFRVSQAATVQVFAPSGKEVFNTSESASVNWNGIHTWEEGTYYVAVHDVTGSRNMMTLDYMHMDKYDVVEWDVHTVGNGGCSTITFKGNGFRDLYAVDLLIAPGDTIHSVDVSHESDAETSVTFDFTGAGLGKYNAVFHFTEEDKPFANVVTVEEAVDIELATNVSFPSTFLRGTSTTYTVKITNMGNMTAYYVPLELRLKVNSIKNISEIHFDGYITPTKLSEVLLSDSLEEETINIIREVENEVSDLSQFVIYSDTLSNVDYGLSQIILSIPPNSTKTFTVAIKSSSTESLEARMTDEWFPLTEYKTSANSRRRVLKASKRDWMCCQRERFECAADALASIAGVFMPPGAGCATSLTLTGLETAYDVWCSDGGSASERWNNYLKSQGQSLANRLIQSAISCVTAYFHLQKKKLMEDRQLAAQLGSSTEVSRINSEIEALRTMERSVIRNIYNGICTSILGANCYKAFTETKPNCPPCTSGCGGGGSSSPVPPADPNDIYGYLSDAGSKFIADTVAKVNYTIEFENDTAFAQASAHTIVIKDTLDSRYFDLKSFLPTTIKLGSRETFLNEADVMTKNGVTGFLKTIDMRPEINAIAQVEGEYSKESPILDPIHPVLPPSPRCT